MGCLKKILAMAILCLWPPDKPEELIAQHPYDKRDEARLLVMDRTTQKIKHTVFKQVIDYLNPGDCLVINISFI